MTTTPASPNTTRAKRAVPLSSYQAEYADRARKLCLLLGADDQELAGFFDVPPATLQEWLASVPEFAAAVRAGRTLALSERGAQLARLYLPITRCALRHSLRDRVKVFAGLYCFTVQLDSFLRTSRLIST